MSTESATTDVVDRVAGIAPGSALWQLRRQRPEVVARTEASHTAALTPADPGGISHAERAALAARMARLNGDPALAAHYLKLLAMAGPAAGAGDLADPDSGVDAAPRVAAILRHVDLVTTDPKSATRADIERLTAAGLSTRDIVSLSGLIAFVNYQQRVVAGLRLLAERSHPEA